MKHGLLVTAAIGVTVYISVNLLTRLLITAYPPLLWIACVGMVLFGMFLVFGLPKKHSGQGFTDHQSTSTPADTEDSKRRATIYWQNKYRNKE